MRMMQLAFSNFKSSFRNYLSIVLSLAFTILVFFNFQNVIYSDAFQVLGEKNSNYVNIMIRVVSIVLVCFMFFFIWYSTNVFLTKRKKDIGIYVFMGLSNDKIGKLYLIETTLIGLTALILGIALGALTSRLFQMILLAISDIAVDIGSKISLQSIVMTAGVYLVIYMIFVLKGYFNIVTSSVLNMISAAKQNEYVRQKKWILVLKTILGCSILATGYYLAVKDAGLEVIANVLAAVILVIIGVYLLFGGLIPLCFQGFGKNKQFLYQKQRCLWINQLIFRIRKNYRTYAMVCVLILCSVTTLATGFAMKNRYTNVMQFENTYTFQVMSAKDDLQKSIYDTIDKVNPVKYQTKIPMLYLEGDTTNQWKNDDMYVILPYSDIKQAAKEADLAFDLKDLADDEIIELTSMPIISLALGDPEKNVTVNGKEYHQHEMTRVPYLGYLQESMSMYIVNDKQYQDLSLKGQAMYTYNYRISDPDKFEMVKSTLDQYTASLNDPSIGRVATDPTNSDSDWIKVTYSLCIFMFLVFILASGSIMFMKLYNDAFEEKERYLIMHKMGIDRSVLRKSVKRELAVSYITPTIVMTVSSYFAVHALGKMMFTDLLSINIISVIIVALVFAVFYVLSVSAYCRNAGC